MLTQLQSLGQLQPVAHLALAQPQAQDVPSHAVRPGDSSFPAAMGWLTLILDEIDYGVLLVSESLEVFYSNLAARRVLSRDNPLRLEPRRLAALQASDATALREAVALATQRRLRRLVVLGSHQKRTVVAIVPLHPAQDGEPAALVMLGKRSVCESLSAKGFASCHGLTPTEHDVLVGLCAGHTPLRIADEHRVSLSTVRAQIASIRSKTGASSIRALLEQVAQLPPLVGMLRSC